MDLRESRRGQEHGEDGLLQLPAGHKPVHEVEARALAHLVEREPEHAVEVEARERVVRLVGRCDEVRLSPNSRDLGRPEPFFEKKLGISIRVPALFWK